MASNASPEVRSSRGGSLIVNDDAADREESPISVDDKSEVDVPEVLTLLGQIYIAVQSLESHVRPRPQTSYRQKPRIPSWMTKNLLLLSLVWQSACVFGLTIVELTNDVPDRQLRRDRTYYISLVVLVIFQTINLLVVILTSVKLTKQVMHHTASASFLFQSYASTLLLFAGMYTLLYRIETTCFTHVIDLEGEKSLLIVELFLKMLYLSSSTGTLCGACKISPEVWYSIMLVMTQMLLSFVYFASILSQATSHHRRSNSGNLNSRRGARSRTTTGNFSLTERTPLQPFKRSSFDVLGEASSGIQ
ncbi:uncharacterized protein LOC134182042 [Corticium candelabrum]|uniref:uncharacterized protein LOC134182042 n=1 Tax=Corticium candelabrum TaxID=121492 RepID=UPI002E271284|nr:uncharacterized protein LOC134182042 [Corticium candelabrum]